MSAAIQGRGPVHVGYMTGEYPRATDTFIQREIAALREEGLAVSSFAARRPKPSELVGPEQREEAGRTTYLTASGPFAFVAAHLACFFASPRRWLGSLRTALLVRSPGLRSLVWQLFYFAEAGILAREVRRRGIRHVHNHFANSSCSVTMLAAEMAGFTYSFTIHGPAIWFAPERWRLAEKIERALFVSCISHFCRSQAMIWTPVERWSRLHIVHCGVDSKRAEPVAHRDGARRLTFVGRLAAVKGLPVLLDALERVPDATLTLVGDGPDRAALEQRARDLGVADRVAFPGYLDQSGVRAVLRETDVFVMSSFAEGVPVVLMEAMAHGVPVVATRIAGVAELVEDGVSGRLVAPGDVDELAESLNELLGDADLRASMGREGRARVEREFDVFREAAWLGRILQSALEGRIESLRPR